MDTIYDLEVKKANLEQEISLAKAKIGKLEREYESLQHFKGVAETAQSNFDSGVNETKNKLQGFSDRQLAQCRTARIYQNGMLGYVNGAGKTVIGGTYAALLKLISARLFLLRSQVKGLDSSIETKEQKLADVNDELARAAEEG